MSEATTQTGARLRRRMRELASDSRTALIIYLTCGDPSVAATADIAIAAAEAGADVIELGVPFSDPNADGVVIQEAMQRALAGGADLDAALATVRAMRERGCDVPVVLFGYYNPVFVRGLDRFAADCADAGVDAVLTVDVPLDELAELATPLAARQIAVVPLVAPTSGADRIAQVAAFAPPFVYYISMTGVTGAALSGAADVAARVAEVRAASGAPVAVGFGIKTPDDAAAMAACADGVVVGSAVVRQIAEAASDGDGDGDAAAAAAVASLVAALRAGVDRADRADRADRVDRADRADRADD